ncbi:MAG TPA: hypothetical protein VJX73_06450 [Terracidiphilus sp.]|nr:hypothetical protein [Terracidiphilus sp.]
MVTGHSILRASIRVIFLVATLPLLAQSVTPVSGSQMLFSDPAFGVSFRFPSGWSFSRVDADSKGPSLAIAYMDGRSVSTGLRGLVTNETLPGLHSWPRTVFSSVEFGYDARPAASADACQRLARDNWEVEAAPVTLNGVTWWHGTATATALSTEIEEDIYATFIEASGSCLRFDLAVATCRVPGRDFPRELTTHEKALIHASLSNILNSVQIAPLAR